MTEEERLKLRVMDRTPAECPEDTRAFIAAFQVATAVLNKHLKQLDGLRADDTVLCKECGSAFSLQFSYERGPRFVCIGGGGHSYVDRISHNAMLDEWRERLGLPAETKDRHKHGPE